MDVHPCKLKWKLAALLFCNHQTCRSAPDSQPLPYFCSAEADVQTDINTVRRVGPPESQRRGSRGGTRRRRTPAPALL